MTARGAQGWASWAIAALAAAAVVAGLAVAGGPMQARKERRDEARMDDLQRLASHIACLVGDRAPRHVPGDLSTTPGCPGPVPLSDSRTGQPYRIEPLEGGKYRLCADFELPPPDPNGWAFAPRDGDCIVQELPRWPREDLPAADPSEVRPLP